MSHGFFVKYRRLTTCMNVLSFFFFHFILKYTLNFVVRRYFTKRTRRSSWEYSPSQVWQWASRFSFCSSTALLFRNVATLDRRKNVPLTANMFSDVPSKGHSRSILSTSDALMFPAGVRRPEVSFSKPFNTATLGRSFDHWCSRVLLCMLLRQYMYVRFTQAAYTVSVSTDALPVNVWMIFSPISTRDFPFWRPILKIVRTTARVCVSSTHTGSRVDGSRAPFPSPKLFCPDEHGAW